MESGQLHILVALLQGRRPQYLMDTRLSRPYSSQSEVSVAKRKLTARNQILIVYLSTLFWQWYITFGIM